MKIPKIIFSDYSFKKCYRCGKRIGYTSAKKQIFCANCLKEVSTTSSLKKAPKNYRSSRYRRLKKELIEIAGHCALCGTKKNLTAHHIGGQENIGLTCLCDECHKAYEAWNMEKKKRPSHQVWKD